jgi:hypothetical protein
MSMGGLWISESFGHFLMKALGYRRLFEKRR